MFNVGTFNSKKKLCYLLIIATVLTVLALPYKQWGFSGDDFGLLFYSTNLIKALSFFTKDITQAWSLSGNDITTTKSFLSVMYRPMQFIFSFIQYCFFGKDPYLYLVFTVFLHAVNTALSFYIFSFFFNVGLSLLGSLLLAFHSLVCMDWIGVYNYQWTLTDLLYLQLIIIFIKYYLTKKERKFIVFALICQALSIFSKETALFYPAIVFAEVYWYMSEINFISFKQAIKKAFKISLGFLLISLFYFFIRIIVFPLTYHSKITTSFQMSASQFQLRFYDILTYVCDLLYINLIPPNHHPWFKLVLLCFAIIVLSYPFFKTIKMRLFFLLFCLATVTWPSFIVNHSRRFLYPGLLFFVGIILYSINYYSKRTISKIISYMVALFIIVGNMTLLVFAQYEKAFMSNIVCSAYKEFAQTHFIRGKEMLFVGLPDKLFPDCGIKQALQIYGNTKDVQVRLLKNSFYEIPKAPFLNRKMNNGYSSLASKYSENITTLLTDRGFILEGVDLVCKKNADNAQKYYTKIVDPTSKKVMFDLKLNTTEQAFITWNAKKQKLVLL